MRSADDAAEPPTGGDVFSRRARRAVFAIGIVSLLGTFAALLFGARFAEPAPSDVDSYGTGALGHHALGETLQRLGVHVVRLRDGRYSEITAPLAFFEPDDSEVLVAGRRFQLGEIVADRQARGLSTLVVLGKWRGRGTLVQPADTKALLRVLRAVTGDPGASIRRSAAAQERSTLALRGAEAARIDVWHPQTAEVSGAEVLLAGEAGAVLIRKGSTVVLTEPDILSNYNLQRADHARLARWLVRDRLGADTLVVDEVFHGHGETPSLTAALGRFPAVLLPLHALVLALLTLIAGWRRFGPVEPAAPAYGRGPAEAIAVGGAVLSVGRAPGRLAVDYVERVIEDLANRLDADAHGAGAAAWLDALARRRGVTPRAAELLDRASQLALRGSARDATRLALAAWTFRSELLATAPSRAAHRRK
jgi:hypothetical protein